MRILKNNKGLVCFLFYIIDNTIIIIFHNFNHLDRIKFQAKKRDRKFEKNRKKMKNETEKEFVPNMKKI